MERNIPKLTEQADNCKYQIQNQRSYAPVARSDEKELNYRMPQQKIVSIDHLRRGYQRVTAINIFSSGWIMSYGVPKTFPFSCRSSSQLETGYGWVMRIGKGEIQVRDFSDNYYFLRLSICTKLLGIASSYVPKVGDVVDWSGSLQSYGIFNAYRADFYPCE